MGASLDKPLADYSSAELATVIHDFFGSSVYQEYALKMRENGVTGALLSEMNEVQIKETLQDLGIENRLHGRVLIKEWKACLNYSIDEKGSGVVSNKRKIPEGTSSLEAAAEYDLTPSTPSSELKPFDDITREAFQEFHSPLYAGVHLVDSSGHVSLSSLQKTKGGGTDTARLHEKERNSFCHNFILKDDRDYFTGKHPSLLPPENEMKDFVSHVVKTPTGERVGTVCILSDDKIEGGESKLEILRRLATKAQEQLELRKALVARNKSLQKQIGTMSSSNAPNNNSTDENDTDIVLLPATGPLQAVTQSQVQNRPSLFPPPEEIATSGKPRRSSTLPIVLQNQASPEAMQHLPPDYYKESDEAGITDRIPVPKGDKERAAAVEALGLKYLDPSSHTAVTIQGLVELASNLFKLPFVEITFQNHDTHFGLARHLDASEEIKARFLEVLKPVNYDSQGTPYLCSESRCNSICNYVSVVGKTFVIHNIHEDESFQWVKNSGMKSIRFYSGAPIWVNGIIVASLCVMDFQERPDFTKEHEVQQEQIANLIAREIENWSLRREMTKLENLRKEIGSHKNKSFPPETNVAICFTDVQGSTSLWEANPETMQEALNLHDQIMRSCCAQSHGYEVTTEGDAFFIAFHDSVDAIRFALTAQKELHNAPWSDEILELPDACDDGQGFRGLRVRIAIHCGSVSSGINEVSGRKEYTGETVNIAKSLEHMSHGGQILVTQDAWAAASYLAETELKSPQVIALGTHVLLSGTSKCDGIITKAIVQLVPAELSFDYFSQSRKIKKGAEQDAKRRKTNLKGSLNGRRFPAVLTKRCLSASFYEAPRNASNVVTMAFIYTSEVEKQYEESTVVLAALAKLVGSLLLENEGYQCKNTMLAFQTRSAAVKFGLKLLAALKEQLLDGKDLSTLVKVGVHEGEFTSMGPHQTTGRADYFGKVVNRAARVAGAAELGQVYLGTSGAEKEEPNLESGLEATFKSREALKGVQEEMALFSCSWGM